MMPFSRLVPEDTGSLITDQAIDECCNLGLLMDRLGPRADALGREGKQTWLNRLVEKRGSPRTRGRLRPIHLDTRLLAACRTRWKDVVERYEGESVTMKTDSPLVVGLGAEHVLETAITLHRSYGFPLIPGSACKGLARTYALVNLAAELGLPLCTPAEIKRLKDKKKPSTLQQMEALLVSELGPDQDKAFAALQGQDGIAGDAPIRSLDLGGLTKVDSVATFRRVFGYLGWAGSVRFFDALPDRDVQMAVDIMTPHFPSYYRSLDGSRPSPPHDADDPTPIPFLVVAQGVTFWFGTGVRIRGKSKHGKDAKWALENLCRALTIGGIGGKTAAGYGFFQEAS